MIEGYHCTAISSTLRSTYPLLNAFEDVERIVALGLEIGFKLQ